MRKKAENERRDRYSRLVAAVIAAECLISSIRRQKHFSLTLEAEDRPLWDDVVLRTGIGTTDEVTIRHQIKRQYSPINENDLHEYFKAAASHDHSASVGKKTRYHLVLPGFVLVEHVGELRVLHDLLMRVQQIGSSRDRIIQSLRQAERTWLDAIKSWTVLDDAAACNVLANMWIEQVGDELQLNNRGERALTVLFDNRAANAWLSIKDIVGNADGVCELTEDSLLKNLPPPMIPSQSFCKSAWVTDGRSHLVSKVT